MRATPVPIPNTVVKPHCGDDTWATCPGKVAHLQIFILNKKAHPIGWAFLFGIKVAVLLSQRESLLA